MSASITARLSRIERHSPKRDWREELTDEELEQAIAAISARIEDATGMTEIELADDLEGKLHAGASLLEWCGPNAVRGYISTARTFVHTFPDGRLPR